MKSIKINSSFLLSFFPSVFQVLMAVSETRLLPRPVGPGLQWPPLPAAYRNLTAPVCSVLAAGVSRRMDS